MSLCSKGATCQNKARPARRRRLEEALGRVEEFRERQNGSGGAAGHPRVPRNPRSLPSRRFSSPPARRPGRAAGPASAGGRTGSERGGPARRVTLPPSRHPPAPGAGFAGGGGVSRSAGGEARPRSAAGVESGERGGEGGRRAPSPWRPQRQSTVAMSFQVRLAVGTDRLRDAGRGGGASRPPSPCAPWGPAAAPARRTPAPGPGCRGPVVMAWFGRASPARGPAGKGAGWCVKPGEELRPRDCALRMQRSWQRPRRRVGLYFSPSCTWTLLIIQTFWG